VAERRLIVASNRGPVSFVRGEDGELEPRRGGVTALTQALQASRGLWIASAMTAEDREAGQEPLEIAGGEGPGIELRYLPFGRRVYDGFYNGISNRVLWFLNHHLWALPREPAWGPAMEKDWGAYRRVNEAFAQALAEEGDRMASSPAYLVQDYHLSLVPGFLRRLRPRASIAHFCHSAVADPSYFATVPARIRLELLGGLLGADVLGFQTERWASNFLACAQQVPGAEVDLGSRTVRLDGREVRVRVYPISIDPEGLKEDATSDEVVAAERSLEGLLGGVRLVLRVDRTDLSKNILRGLLAFETFLRDNPAWRERVVHLALLNPSRASVPEYRQYLRECRREVERINAELGSPGWRPIRAEVRDQHARALAAFGLYDVLLVNPLYDGMNLVAKEGSVLNRNDGVLVLSENAGAHAELGDDALSINPFDVRETADAIARALEMPREERAARANRLREAVHRNRLEDWVGNQLRDLGASSGE
jgi:trehalose 6-phosphate synthase